MKTASLSLTHIIRPADTSIKNPAVLFMFHGYGSNKEDLFSFASELPSKFCIISVEAPNELQPYGYAWYAIHFDAIDGKWSDDNQAIASRDLIANFITEACNEYQLDPTNVTLLGCSQGSVLSYAVALSYPEKVKNVIALSGYINQGILKPEFQSNDFSNLAVYASHGSVDQVIPVEWARKTPDFLDQFKIKHVYEEFPVGHGVAPQNFFSFKNWLELQD